MDMQVSYSICNPILNHTNCYEYKYGKILLHLKICFESLSLLGDFPYAALQYYRELNGLTRKELAEKLHITPETLLAYEKGKRPILYTTALNISMMLNINKELLFDNYCRFLDYPYYKRLKKVQKYQCLNQTKFAKSLGISLSSYAKWECGIGRASRRMYDLLIEKYPEIKC